MIYINNTIIKYVKLVIGNLNIESKDSNNHIVLKQCIPKR